MENETKRDPRALNAYRHGLTGHIHISTPAEKIAYDAHCKGLLDALGASGAVELELAQAIADDRWRLKLGTALSGSIFALGIQQLDQINPHPEVDVALKQAQMWIKEGKNLALLSLYEQRMQRRVEKNMKILADLQRVRIAAFEQAVAEATLLAQYAAMKGEAYDIERDFPPCSLPGQFVFSNAEIARRANHNVLLAAAKKALAEGSSPGRKLRRVA
jgi:hypothetical protein